MQALNFLFWNTNRKPLIKEIANIAKYNNIDVILLAEHNLNDVDLLLELNSESFEYYLPNPIFQSDRIKIFTKFDNHFIIPVADEFDNRFTCFKIVLPPIEELLVFGVHLPSRKHASPASISANARELASKVKEIEKILNLNNTIVVGDFNVNPSDESIIGAGDFHAVMDSKIAKKMSRTVSGEKRDYFYNPMWSLHGDVGNNVAGSYYYNQEGLVSNHWNVFDQVLFRPSLIDNFEKDSLRFVDSDGEKTLLTNRGLPSNKYSDHLPLIFTLNLDLK